MKGLLVWAHSHCRSTLAFYSSLANAFGVPLRILVWLPGISNRTAVGHSENEFDHLDARFIGDDLSRARRELDERADWHHIFGTYQKGSVFRRMLLDASQRGARVAIASEAPCNMTPPPLHIAKQIYIDSILPRRVARHIAATDFILNLSGNDATPLARLGWPESKILACGYFPPPLVGSSFRQRTREDRKSFTLLHTGELQWHRNPLLLLRALLKVKRRGLECHATITQRGPLLKELETFASRHHLHVSFVGRVPYAELLDLYARCSCFVATGRAEPWGMRVNDALNCGAPILVSDGMGAAMIPSRFGCGARFTSDDDDALAETIVQLATSEAAYMKATQATTTAREACSPESMGKTIAGEIAIRWPQWS